jgi:hypothetical protein
LPTISWFDGISIRMFFNDHAPPHFHAVYGDDEAQIEIATGRVIRGRLPTAQRRLVREWTLRYHGRLMVSWEQAQSDKQPDRIPGLGADDDA